MIEAEVTGHVMNVIIFFLSNLNPENDGAKENSKIVKSKGSELAYGLSTMTLPRMPVCIYDGKGHTK